MPNNATPECANEPDRSDYPTTLKTYADYDDAPVGTLVEIDGLLAKRQINGWLLHDDEPVEIKSRHMPTVGEGEVVRWGEDYL